MRTIRLIDGVLMAALGFLAGVCLMDAQSRPAIESLASDNTAMGITTAMIVAQPDPNRYCWVPPWEQVKRMRRAQ